MNNRVEATKTISRMDSQTGPHRASEVRQSYIMESLTRKRSY